MLHAVSSALQCFILFTFMDDKNKHCWFLRVVEVESFLLAGYFLAGYLLAGYPVAMSVAQQLRPLEPGRSFCFVCSLT